MPGPIASEHVIRTEASADPVGSEKTRDNASLWGIFRLFAGVLKSLQSIRKQMVETARRQRFLFLARMDGGRVELMRSARFYECVTFAGKGKLVISVDVILGWPPAGMVDQALLLQPREKDSVISIGEGTFIMNGCEFIARQSIRIGKKCLIGAGTIIYDSNFHTIDPIRRNEPDMPEAVTMDDNVWVGRGVMILKGVKIGRDAVIGAGSIVTKDVAAGEIVAGNPAKAIGSVYPQGGQHS